MKREKLFLAMLGNAEEFKFEHRHFNAICIFGVIIAIISAIINIVAGLDPILFVFIIVLLISCVTGYYYGRVKRNYRPFVLPVFVTIYLMLVSLWILNGGLFGGSKDLFYLAMIGSLIIIHRKWKFPVLTGYTLTIGALIFFEYHFPQFITVYSNRFGSFMDVGGSSIMVTILCGASIIAFAKNYEQTYELLQQEKQKSDIQTRELASVNQKLVELDTAKTNFFSNISHEFRTPLTLMLTPLESAISGTSGDLVMLKRETAESMRQNCLRLLRLINDLLDFTKIEAGKMSINRQPTDIDAFLRQFTAVVNSAAESMGINLEYIPPKEKIIGEIDRKLMENALYNLISNALKFTPKGGQVLVRLETFQCARENTDGASLVQNYFSITVSDTGIGISTRDLEMIFERFTQVDASTSRKYEGSGIGLSITKELVEMHGGVISVESEPEKGSSFKITIPCNCYANEISDETGNGDGINHRLWGGIIPHDTAIQPVVKGEDELETILVVEDNPEMIKLLNMILEGKYNLINAMNGRDALEKMDSNEALPDLVLADIMMPEMNGYEFTRLVRADGRFEGVPVILLTAKADDSMKMEGFESGATDYITKPFNARELTARINAQLEMKKLRDRLSLANQQLYAKLKAATVPAQPSISDSTEQKINLVLNFIHENYSASLSREGLAGAVDLSADHLSRAFNRVTGKRIDEYINDLRLDEAKRRLRETADTVISIAFAVGFENVRTFNKVFSKGVGITPSQWRQSEK